jgi:hypothetical protein
MAGKEGRPDGLGLVGPPGGSYSQGEVGHVARGLGSLVRALLLGRCVIDQVQGRGKRGWGYGVRE